MTVTAFLRWALLGDALASGGTALLLITMAGLLQGFLGMPASFLSTAGWVLVPYVALVAFLGTRQSLPRWAVWLVIVVNVVWTIESFAVLTSESMQPTVLGQLFVIAQALVVFGFAGLQVLALRRAQPARA